MLSRSAKPLVCSTVAVWCLMRWPAVNCLCHLEPRLIYCYAIPEPLAIVACSHWITQTNSRCHWLVTCKGCMSIYDWLKSSVAYFPWLSFWRVVTRFGTKRHYFPNHLRKLGSPNEAQDVFQRYRTLGLCVENYFNIKTYFFCTCLIYTLKKFIECAQIVHNIKITLKNILDCKYTTYNLPTKQYYIA